MSGIESQTLVTIQQPPTPSVVITGENVLIQTGGAGTVAQLTPQNLEARIAQDEGVLVGFGISGANVPTLFIQPNAPVGPPNKYIWIQTEVGGDPDDFTVFFEDGC